MAGIARDYGHTVAELRKLWAAGELALALAGLLAERPRAAGRRVAVIQTGGNADADLLLQVLAGRTPAV